MDNEFGLDSMMYVSRVYAIIYGVRALLEDGGGVGRVAGGLRIRLEVVRGIALRNPKFCFSMFDYIIR